MIPRNLLILMSDELIRGDGLRWPRHHQTLNLDALAARGTRSRRRTHVPDLRAARASFATGRYVHQEGYWDNADGEGAIPSWHHQS
jgi:choline-sulfatase